MPDAFTTCIPNSTMHARSVSSVHLAAWTDLPHALTLCDSYSPLRSAIADNSDLETRHEFQEWFCLGTARHGPLHPTAPTTNTTFRTITGRLTLSFRGRVRLVEGHVTAPPFRGSHLPPLCSHLPVSDSIGIASLGISHIPPLLPPFLHE